MNYNRMKIKFRNCLMQTIQLLFEFIDEMKFHMFTVEGVIFINL